MESLYMLVFSNGLSDLKSVERSLETMNENDNKVITIPTAIWDACRLTVLGHQ